MNKKPSIDDVSYHFASFLESLTEYNKGWGCERCPITELCDYMHARGMGNKLCSLLEWINDDLSEKLL